MSDPNPQAQGATAFIRNRDRLDQIYRVVREEGNASVSFLAHHCKVSESTIRRDINNMLAMDSYPNLERVHGGVVISRREEDASLMFDLKFDLARPEKEAIAAEVVLKLHDGESIALDTGTTCLLIARRLEQLSGLKVIATDVKVAEQLGQFPDIETVVAGGLIRPAYFGVGGAASIEFLDQFRVDTAIIAADSVDPEDGITNRSLFEVGVKRKLMEIARRVILVADSSKIGKRSLYRVSDFHGIERLITDRGLSDEYVVAFRERGLQVDLV
ncbi:MAG: DeoR/GlpR family DNA-binding transcription regulator [Spirochaetales bacterium]|nr:DeoR/GlpR family DNA-binding transcription regulator [Spirochaetales bacterium]MCF7936997.1 DeoR/GlpR family DNA-binding transcription regulator [Spirochaetales bacterium]